MNNRKNIDYSEVFATIDKALFTDLSQVKLYCEIGKAISTRPERGAAVAAAEYLQKTYPGVQGFSPRNVRRMREFYTMYGNKPKILRSALYIGWTQNVVILESELTIGEKWWYIRAVQKFGWSKSKLAESIAQCAHNEIALDTENETCYYNEVTDNRRMMNPENTAMRQHHFSAKKLFRLQGRTEHQIRIILPSFRWRPRIPARC